MARDWTLVLHDPRSGDEVALEGWQSFDVTENFDGTSGSLEIPVGAQALNFVQELVTDLLMYFDHRLVYRMRIIDSEDTLTTESHTVSLDLLDYRGLLSRRVLFDDFELALDQHLWAWTLIEYTQGFEDLGIRRAPDFAPSGQGRDRVVEKGKTVTEAIDELAQTDNGFDWWIDENLLFHAQTPRRLFDTGLDVLWGAEVASLTRGNAVDTYADVILAIGATGDTTLPGGTVYPPPDPVILEQSVKPFGRWERSVSYSDIVTEESLVGRAVWHLADSTTLRPQYNIELTQGVWVPAVRPGGTFLLRVRSRPRLDLRVLTRIETVSLTLDPNGVEIVKLGCRAEEAEVAPPTVPTVARAGVTAQSGPSGAVLVDPSAPTGRSATVAFTSDTDALGALLASLRGRIGRQERIAGTGGGTGGASAILDGEGPPPEDLGVPGNYYVDTLNQLLYGPKNATFFGGEQIYPIPDPVDSNRINEVTRVDLWAVTPCRLLGWRYKRLATSSPTLTFKVWRLSGAGPAPELLLTLTDTRVGDGEFEMRLPSPVAFGELTVNLYLSMEGAATPIGSNNILAFIPPASSWSCLMSGYYGPLGSFPTTFPGFPGTAPYIEPIVQVGHPIWPQSNAARSNNPPGMRVELARPADAQARYRDDWALRFYEGGQSEASHVWDKGEGVDWFSLKLGYSGYSGIELDTDDWYDTENNPAEGEEQRYTNKYAYYFWAYDYAWWEQDADLDADHPTAPGSYYMTFGEQSTWDSYSYWDFFAYGPRHGASVDGETTPRLNYGGVGFSCEVAELRHRADPGSDDSMTAVAKMSAMANDGRGTTVQVTPDVIQACFPPQASGQSWWAGDLTTDLGMTPRGCLSPLVSAVSTAPAIGEQPWQKQYFRQIGTDATTFAAGVGTIYVPTPMGLPAVVNAQVNGATPGGSRVAQASRTDQNTITVALDTTLSGSVEINWSVEHAMAVFPDPAPMIAVFSNPGSFALYFDSVEYEASGGLWPFEIHSRAETFRDGCILRDFNGATVGGPFTTESTAAGQYVSWSAGRNWHLPGETAYFEMVNPDGQSSGWYPIQWYESSLFAARATSPGTGGSAAAPTGETYANDPANPANQRVITPVDARERLASRQAAGEDGRGRRKGGKQQKAWTQANRDRRQAARSEGVEPPTS